MPWNEEIAHWLLTTLQDDRRADTRGERQRVVEIAFRRRAIAHPARGDTSIATQRRAHRPADRLNELRAERCLRR